MVWVSAAFLLLRMGDDSIPFMSLGRDSHDFFKVLSVVNGRCSPPGFLSVTSRKILQIFGQDHFFENNSVFHDITMKKLKA